MAGLRICSALSLINAGQKCQQININSEILYIEAQRKKIKKFVNWLFVSVFSGPLALIRAGAVMLIAAGHQFEKRYYTETLRSLMRV